MDISRNSSSSNFSSNLLKKVDIQNNNNNNLNSIPIKNETTTKYKKAFEILNNMNNNKYTLKYIEESKLKNKNSENDILNNNIANNHNRIYSPNNLNCNKNKNYNRSTSYLIKANNNNKNEKHKNRSMKKNNSSKINIKDKEKIKESNSSNIHEYKINNLSSNYNNNFTNIKTNKIVFIDLKNNNNNFLKNDLNNDNPNDSKFNYNDRYTRNVNQNAGDEINNNLIFHSSGNGNINNTNKVQKNIKPSNTNINNNNSYNNSNNKLNNTNKKNNPEEKIILRSSKKGSDINSNISNNIKANKNKFSNLTMQKLDQNKSDNIPNNFTILEDNKRILISSKNNQIDTKELKNKELSIKECAFYILSKSPVLRLCERMIFSRSCPALRNILTKEIIINENQIILENKIDELEKKIILCDKILDTPFTASKTADITLNFITSLQEIEFKEYPILIASEEEKKYYLNYLKILYYLLNEEIESKTSQSNNLMDNNNMILSLRQNLYIKINNKGFRTIRDYLYNIYITNKDNIKEIPKIVEINYLVSQVNNMFEIHNSLKICKFISFTLYLVKEIVKFGNNIKSSVELKIKAKNLIDIINKKLNKYKAKYKNK